MLVFRESTTIIFGRSRNQDTVGDGIFSLDATWADKDDTRNE